MLDGGLVDGGHDLLVERCNDGCWRLGGRHHAYQCGSLHAGQAQFGKGGHIRQLRQTRGVGHSQGAHLAALDKTGPRGHVHHHHGDLAARHIGQRRRCTAIRGVGQLQTGFALEQFHGQMVGAACTGGGIVHAVLAGLDLGNELLGGLGFFTGAGHQNHGKAPHQRDGRQILAGVVAQVFVEHGVEDQRAVVGRDDGVAVRRGAGGFRGANGGVAAGAVVHHDGLVYLRRPSLTDGAGQKVRATARGVGHDPAHALGGELVLGDCGCGGASQPEHAGGQNRGGKEAFVHWVCLLGWM